MPKPEQTLLAFAVFISLLTSHALIHSYSRAHRRTFVTAFTQTESVVIKDESKKDANGSKKANVQKVIDESEVIDEAYQLIHQRYNRESWKWEDFDPRKDAKSHEGIIFIVYHRHHEPTAIRPVEIVVEIESDSVKEVLKQCVPYIDSVFDPTPLVRISLRIRLDGRLILKSCIVTKKG